MLNPAAGIADSGSCHVSRQRPTASDAPGISNGFTRDDAAYWLLLAKDSISDTGEDDADNDVSMLSNASRRS